MVIFHSYVSLPEGTSPWFPSSLHRIRYICCFPESHVELSACQELPDDYDVAAEKALNNLPNDRVYLWKIMDKRVVPGFFIGKLDYQTLCGNCIEIVPVENNQMWMSKHVGPKFESALDRSLKFIPSSISQFRCRTFKVSPISFDARPSLIWWPNTKRSLQRIAPMHDVYIYIYKTSWSLEQMHACLCGLHHDQQTLLHFTTQSRRVVALHVLHWSIRYMNVYYINYLIVLMLWLTYLFFAEYVWVCQRVSLNPGLFFSSLKTPFGAINLLFSDT